MGVATCVKEREAKQISIMRGKYYYNTIYLINYSALCRIHFIILYIIHYNNLYNHYIYRYRYVFTLYYLSICLFVY